MQIASRTTEIARTTGNKENLSKCNSGRLNLSCDDDIIILRHKHRRAGY